MTTIHSTIHHYRPCSSRSSMLESYDLYRTIIILGTSTQLRRSRLISTRPQKVITRPMAVTNDRLGCISSTFISRKVYAVAIRINVDLYNCLSRLRQGVFTAAFRILPSSICGDRNITACIQGWIKDGWRVDFFPLISCHE